MEYTYTPHTMTHTVRTPFHTDDLMFLLLTDLDGTETHAHSPNGYYAGDT